MTGLLNNPKSSEIGNGKKKMNVTILVVYPSPMRFFHVRKRAVLFFLPISFWSRRGLKLLKLRGSIKKKKNWRTSIVARASSVGPDACYDRGIAIFA